MTVIITFFSVSLFFSREKKRERESISSTEYRHNGHGVRTARTTLSIGTVQVGRPLGINPSRRVTTTRMMNMYIWKHTGPGRQLCWLNISIIIFDFYSTVEKLFRWWHAKKRWRFFFLHFIFPSYIQHVMIIWLYSVCVSIRLKDAERWKKKRIDTG
jgi:hypothetical protein